MKVKELKGRFYSKKGGPRGIGNNCKEYAAGCIVCESHKFFKERGRFPSFDEIHPIAHEASQKEHEAWIVTEEGQKWQAKVNAKKAKAQAAKTTEG